MWHELLDLLVGGYLTIPEGVRTIFTDGGAGEYGRDVCRLEGISCTSAGHQLAPASVTQVVRSATHSPPAPLMPPHLSAGYVPLDGNWSSLAEGCYYHTAFYGGGGGAGNQLMEMIPGARIINQLLNVIDNSKDTFMFVLNPSDIRPNPMTTGLTYDFIYNPSKYNQTTDNYAAARMYYAQFGVDYNGLSAADSITYASIWEQYFNISFIFAANSGDLLLAYDVGNAAQSIANDWKAGKGVSQQTINNINFRISQINAQQALTQLQALNQTAYQLFANVPANRRGFYVSHTLLNLATNIASVQALVLMGSAAQALASQGGNAPNPASGTAIAQQALAAMDQLFAIRRVTEGDSSAWAGVVDPIVNMPQAQPMRAYYLADSLSDMQWPRGAIESLLVSLDQQTAGQPLLPVRQSVWYQFEAYQQENKQNYPLVSFNPNWNLPTWVRCNCRTSDVQGNTCGNGPDGGWFTQGSDTRVTMQILDSTTAQAPHNATRGAMLELAKHGYIPSSSRNLVNSIVNDPQATLNIYYTSDGSVPTTSSPQYTPGNAPRLTDLLQSGQTSVTVKAAGWVNGVALGQVTTTTWDART